MIPTVRVLPNEGCCNLRASISIWGLLVDIHIHSQAFVRFTHSSWPMNPVRPVAIHDAVGKILVYIRVRCFAVANRTINDVSDVLQLQIEQ
jgi:hypothetical protein